jgi:hypothetical protein
MWQPVYRGERAGFLVEYEKEQVSPAPLVLSFIKRTYVKYFFSRPNGSGTCSRKKDSATLL